MSDTGTLPPNPVRLHKALARIWATPPGFGRFSAVNHTIVGMRFMVTAAVFFAIGGMLAMIIRAQLATPHSAFLGPDIYNQIFTMHGTIMMFLFAIPMLEGLAIYMLPKLLGARDLAFPRLSAFGYWCFLFGGLILIGALVMGVAPDAGWFMYAPLSSDVYSPGINSDVWLLGVTFVEISAMTLAVELVVSVLKVRAAGMTLRRMPIFAWYILVTALMMVVGFPPLILASILLEMERAFGLPYFDPERGGDPLLWAHLFWLFGHPEVYIIFLPAAGALSTIIPVFAQRPLVGYMAVVIAIIAMAFLSFLIWAHHMFTVGIPHISLAFFSFGSALVAVPTSVQIFAWLATLATGRPRWDVPMLYVFGFIMIFVFGGLTGVMLAMVPFNWQAHDTHFVVAHLHYVLVGGFIFPMLAALYYWLPQVTGRLPVHRLSVPAFWLIFIGFNLTFLIMHFTGLLGMPRRIYTYFDTDGWTWLNLTSSVGGFILTMGFALVAMDIILQRQLGKRFRRDPWRAGTLEWAMPTPPTPYGFASLPRVAVRADQLEPRRVGPELASGAGYLGHARNGWQETLGVHRTTGEPDQVLILPRPTYTPFAMGVVALIAVLAMLFQAYVVALVAAAGFAGLVVWGARHAGLREDHGALPIGGGLAVPPHPEAADPPPVLAMGFTLLATGTIYACLIFSVFYLWLVAPNWPPPEFVEPGWIMPGVALAGLLAGPVAARWAAWANRRGRVVWPWVAAQALAGLVALAALVLLIMALPDPRTHAYLAVNFALLGYGCLHVGIAMLFLVSNAQRLATGYITPRRSMDLRLTRMWQDYTAATGVLSLVLVLVLPLLVEAV